MLKLPTWYRYENRNSSPSFPAGQSDEGSERIRLFSSKTGSADLERSNRQKIPSMQGWTGSRRFTPLLQFACHRVVPIHKCTLRIVAPSPDMQLKERIQAEPVRSADELKILTIE